MVFDLEGPEGATGRGALVLVLLWGFRFVKV